MNCLIAFACLLAVASAGYAPIGLTSEARLVDPVAIAAGAPLPGGDTVEVAAAKAAHHHAHAAARGLAYASPAVAYTGYAPVAPIALASQARLIDPVAIAAGAPLPGGDTVEVAAAKAAHNHAHAVAKGLAFSSPVVAYSGYAPAAPINFGYTHPAPLAIASQARLVDPVAIAAGAPLPTGDTVEVAAAKALHYQAHVNAKSGHFFGRFKRSPLVIAAPIATHLGYTAPLSYAPHTIGYSTYGAPLGYSGLVSPYYG